MNTYKIDILIIINELEDNRMMCLSRANDAVEAFDLLRDKLIGEGVVGEIKLIDIIKIDENN